MLIAILLSAATLQSGAATGTEIPMIEPFDEAMRGRTLTVLSCRRLGDDTPAPSQGELQAPNKVETTPPVYVPGSDPNLAYRHPLVVMLRPSGILVTLNGGRSAACPGPAPKAASEPKE